MRPLSFPALERMTSKSRKRGASAREHYRALAKLVKADGCSSAPDLWFKECCDTHDVNYRTGEDCDGNPITRAQADKLFRQCLHKSAITPFGRYVLSWVYWGAVRAFGGRYYQQSNSSTGAQHGSGQTGR